MWNLTPESIQQVKEELKGRRAAIQARHAEELKSLEADLDEIETLERVAYAVAAKHAPEPAAEPLEVEPEPEAEPQAVAALEAEPVAAVEPEPVSLRGSKSLSRWRMRLDTNSEAESA
jgi:hypothetical protein